MRRDCWSAREQQLKMWWGGKEESCSASPLSPPSIIRRSYLVFGGGDVLLDQLSPFLLLTPSAYSPFDGVEAIKGFGVVVRSLARAVTS